MKKRDVINLVSYSWTTDEFGVRKKEFPIKKEVIVYVESVTGSEYFQGGANGLRPQYRFTMFAPDYDGQEIVEYDGELYSVYRTYLNKTFELELYVERRKGDEA